MSETQEQHRLKAVAFVQYKTAADIVASYASGTTHATWASLEASEFEIDGACVGVEGTATHDPEFMRGLVVETEDLRVWGFAVGDEIHIWWANDADLLDVAHLLGHELTHVIRDDGSTGPIADDEWERKYAEEEDIAECYGVVAKATVEALQTLGFIPRKSRELAVSE